MNLREEHDLKEKRKASVDTQVACVPVVAIGSSVGGLHPLEQFFEALTMQPTYAFVVIQHLSPEFRRVIDALLLSRSKMVVKSISDGVALEPNTMYLNNPKTEVLIENNCLRVHPVSDSEESSMPINQFFQSLAQSRRNEAIGVIFSGMGTDGTKGCAAIAHAGGSVFVQDPLTTRFAVKPKSVIDSVEQAVIGSPEMLATAISELTFQRSNTAAGKSGENTQLVNELRAQWAQEIGFTSGQFDDAIVTRMIEQLINVKGVDQCADNHDSVFLSIDELSELHSNLLEEAAELFSDLDALEYLKNTIIPKIFQSKETDDPIRIWVPMCSCGSDVYTMAVLFHEHARLTDSKQRIEIIATDSQDFCFDFAIAALYTGKSIQNIPSEMIDRYFDVSGGQFRVKPYIKSKISVIQHDLVQGPALTNIDFCCCRKSISSLSDSVLKQVLSHFHASLVKTGYLFFGENRLVGAAANEFDTLNIKWGIYQKRRYVEPLLDSPLPEQNSQSSVNIPTLDNTQDAPADDKNKSFVGSEFYRVQGEAMQRVILRSNTIGFLLSVDGKLVHIFGDAEELLPLNDGEFSHLLVDLVRPELKTLVSNILQLGMGDGFSGLSQRFSVNFEGLGVESYNVSLENVDVGERACDYQILCFEKILSPDDGHTLSDDSTGNSQIDFSGEHETADPLQSIEELHRQLNSGREKLQLALSDLEFSNEGLQSSNQELRSTTEELQRTVQELHSISQELSTVSAELISKNQALTERSRDVEVLLAFSRTGTVHFDKNLKLVRYSENSSAVFKLSPQDIGRTSSSLSLTVNGVNIHDSVLLVHESSASKEFALTVDNRSFLLRILPYTLKNRRSTEGVIIVIQDVTDLHNAHNKIASLKEQFQVVMDSAPNIIVRWDAHTNRITHNNTVFAKLWGCKPEQMNGKNIIDLITESEKEDFEDFLFQLTLGEVSHQTLVFFLENDTVSPPVSVIIQAFATQNDTVSEFQLIGI